MIDDALNVSTAGGKPESSAVCSNVSTSREYYLPGERGVWIFIVGDMLVFGLFFVVFAIYRARTPDLYGDAQMSMNQTLGLVNTVVLICGSWLVAQALQYARRGKKTATIGLLASTAACGLAFCALKGFEYKEKMSFGITLNTNEFFQFYFMYTGIHLLHVVIGTAAVAYAVRVSIGSNDTTGRVRLIESAAVFWHFVDIVWIVLFSILYLAK
jgi:nitric oxide reductase NorE protein